MSSILKVDTINEVTSANGVTVDGLSIKDSKLVTADSVVTANITNSNITVGKMAANSVDSDQYVDGSIDTIHIADDQITLAKMASGTDGNIISYDTSGNPVAVATGSSGQVLTSAGAGAVPSFQAAAAGGKILQVVGADTSTEVTNSGTSYATSGLAKAITPSASSSKILVLVGSNFRVSGDGGASNKSREGKIAIFRGTVSGTLLQQQIIGITNREDSSDSGNQTTTSIAFAYLDNPNTTSATTYTVGIAGLNNGDAQAQPFNYGSSMVLLEVGA
jgi:hypothetical protein